MSAVVVGAGPNGLAAAIVLARAGLSVLVVERNPTVGGGARSAELTLPGFVHDVCSEAHPFAASSPLFSTLPLEQHGLRWRHAEFPLAHPLDDGTAAVLHRDLHATAADLGADGGAWRGAFEHLVDGFGELAPGLLGPLLRVPEHPIRLARFGLQGVRSAAGFARRRFATATARALFAGSAAHAITPLEQPTTAAMGLVLTAAGHAVGWPVAEGGSQAITDALAAELERLGGRIETGREVTDLGELPDADVVMLDVVPRSFVRMAGDRLGGRAAARYLRWRHGPAAFKVDYALDGVVPWRAEACRRAGTVHVGGTLEELAAGEREVAAGRIAERPFVLVGQQSVADPTRAPEGRHTLWAYAHVPNGCDVDVSGHIEAQIERFAPGFRERILARHVHAPAALEAYNPNYVGGDIAGGAQGPVQLALRMAVPTPYATPLPGVYLCSASTAPGAGVHGMCGYHAARAALRRLERGR